MNFDANETANVCGNGCNKNLLKSWVSGDRNFISPVKIVNFVGESCEEVI